MIRKILNKRDKKIIEEIILKYQGKVIWISPGKKKLSGIENVGFENLNQLESFDKIFISAVWYTNYISNDYNIQKILGEFLTEYEKQENVLIVVNNICNSMPWYLSHILQNSELINADIIITAYDIYAIEDCYKYNTLSLAKKDNFSELISKWEFKKKTKIVKLIENIFDKIIDFIYEIIYFFQGMNVILFIFTCCIAAILSLFFYDLYINKFVPKENLPIESISFVSSNGTLKYYINIDDDIENNVPIILNYRKVVVIETNSTSASITGPFKKNNKPYPQGDYIIYLPTDANITLNGTINY